MVDMLKEEIEELKEGIDRKEYLLQYNDQKYYQYEKVLRDLILDTNTPEPVKDQLREKIENQELCVPREERKCISNLFSKNQELNEQIIILKEENHKMRV